MWCGTRARPSSSRLVGVEDEQVGAGAAAVEDDREQHALVLGSVAVPGEGTKTGSPGYDAGLAPALGLAALDVDLDQLVEEVGGLAVRVPAPAP